MSDELRVSHRPELNRPVMITAFRGWNDGGQGASLAGGYLAKTWAAERFADIEPESFFDFQATRPHVSIVDLARELGVEMMITLGSLLADVPHTRPSPVTGGATDPELIERLGLQRSRYEGPTGIVGVLHDACAKAHIPSVSLWAAVPHYVSLAPSPRAALALCQRLGDILGTTIDTEELDEAAERYSEQVSEAVASDEETAAYVAELEERAEILDDEQEIPSGESLAAELTRFLRDRERGNGGPEQSGPSPHPQLKGWGLD